MGSRTDVRLPSDQQSPNRGAGEPERGWGGQARRGTADGCGGHQIGGRVGRAAGDRAARRRVRPHLACRHPPAVRVGYRPGGVHRHRDQRLGGRRPARGRAERNRGAVDAAAAVQPVRSRRAAQVRGPARREHPRPARQPAAGQRVAAVLAALRRPGHLEAFPLRAAPVPARHGGSRDPGWGVVDRLRDDRAARLRLAAPARRHPVEHDHASAAQCRRGGGRSRSAA